MQSQIWAATVPVWITYSPRATGPSTRIVGTPGLDLPGSRATSLSTATGSQDAHSAGSQHALSVEPLTQYPFIAHIPRLSYLPLLLPRLRTHFGVSHVANSQSGDRGWNGGASWEALGSFWHEGVELKNLPVGLLCDLHAPVLPWRIELREGWVFDVRDGWVNSVKEADFMRNGNARGVMSMSKEDSTQLWNAVQDNDLSSYNSIHTRLLNPASPLRHIPFRLFIPVLGPLSTPPTATAITPTTTPANITTTTTTITPPRASFHTLQTLIPPILANSKPQTLGTALHDILPALFPSTSEATMAEVVLHGVKVPFGAELEVLMREGAYADGWVCGVVVLRD